MVVPALTDVFPIDQGIVTYKESASQLLTLFQANGAVLSEVNDTNVTMTLGGNPSTALLNATSMTLGWTGQLAVSRGGTGGSTFTAYSVICAGTTATGAFQNVSGVGSANQVLVSNGVGALPTWQSVPGVVASALTSGNDTNVTLTLGGTPATALLQATSITAGWTGQLSLTRGGTNASLTANNGGIFYSTASAAAILSGTATATQMLQSGVSAAPAWSATTWPATSTINQLLYSSSANTIVGLATANSSVLVTSAGGVPSLSTTLPSGLTIPGYQTSLTLPLSLANGGTAANLTASNGGIFYSTASAGAILSGTATANQILLSGSSTTPAWSTATYPATTTINQILYSSSANVIAGLATANSGVLVTSSGGIPSISTTLPNSLAMGTPASLTLTNATGLPVAGGGTGNSTFTAYAVICAGTTATGVFQNVSGLGSSGQILTSNGAGALPTWQTGSSVTPAALTSGNDTNVTLTLGGTPATALLQAASVTAGWTGTLSLARGGTAANLTASNGGIFYSTGSAGAILAGTATAGQLLTSGASTAPAWTTSTYPLTNAINTLLYASSSNVMAALATANSGVLVTSAGGVPSISSTLPSFTTNTITFNPTTAGIKGTTTNDNGASSYVGEFVSSVIASASAVNFANNTNVDLTSISLTAGDWDVWGNLTYVTLGSVPTETFAWINSVSATTPDSSLYNAMSVGAITSNVGNIAPSQRFSLSGTTTIYISGAKIGTSGNATVCGGIYARRRR